MTKTLFPHLMLNIAWNELGWEDMDAYHRGKERFGWTRENPDDHCDAFMFNREALESEDVFINSRFPRRYSNGNGLVFVQAWNPNDEQRYIVGFFDSVWIYEDMNFRCNLENSVRLAFPVKLNMERHCPLTATGSQRIQIVGENNFNYITDKWAKRILIDALIAHYSHSPKEAQKYFNPLNDTDIGVLIVRALENLGVKAPEVSKHKTRAFIRRLIN